MSIKSQEGHMRQLALLLTADLDCIFGERESGPNGSKKAFLNVGKVFLRALAKDLGLHEVTVSANSGGIAVSGTCSLYGMWEDRGIAVWIEQRLCADGKVFCYRTIRSSRDFKGGYRDAGDAKVYNQTNPDGEGYTPTTTCGHVFYDDDGNPKYTYVDRSFWNTTDYPSCMANGHCHKDCACFVSQCMVAGGINPTNTWYYSSTKWASASELIKFITSSEVGGYATTYTNCNAGNIVYWTGHITLCTLNDTVTHRYTGHTNDRNNSKFSSATAYYAINLT